MSYVVTRQLQWPEGDPVVEVSEGGIDYINPDALVPIYDGEFKEYSNPVEAVETAIDICKEWRKDGWSDAQIGIRVTRDFTMPFEACPFDYARAWSEKTLEALEKCAACNEIIEGAKEWYEAGVYTENNFFSYNDGLKYCSSCCAKKHSVFEE